MLRVCLPGPGTPVILEGDVAAEEAPTMIEFVITLLLLACGIVAGLALMGPAGGPGDGRLRHR
ncbi:hypothetical protein AB0B31_20925 [Catellatospora citrea]|uniref:hypothetical protein n=1 Tax=Catellatospora citrea TaxID=53366 RepID=UPI003406AD82